jgi:hypothetical protein
MENLDVEIERAVSYCTEGYEIAFRRTLLQGRNNEEAHMAASEFFKLGLPRLYLGPRTKVFIACVAAGIARRVFNRRDAGALLYAAQLMQQIFNERKRQNRPASRIRSSQQQAASS